MRIAELSKFHIFGKQANFLLVDQENFIYDRVENGVQFYKYPFLEIGIATDPVSAIQDLAGAWNTIVNSQEDATVFLQSIVNRGRSVGLQIFLYVEYLGALPASSRLTQTLLSLNNDGKLYSTPAATSNYSIEKLKRILNI